MLARVAADMPDFPLQAIALICAPFDLGMCTNLMRNKVYEGYLVEDLLKESICRKPISTAEEKVFIDFYAKFKLDADVVAKINNWD